MLRPAAVLAVTCNLLACGLERDWERWQQASQSGTSNSESSTTASESSDTSTTADTSTTTSPLDDTTSNASDDTTSTASTTSDPTSDTGTTTPAICGDGIPGPGEECDDIGDIHCFNCFKDRRVFVTSEHFQGDWSASSQSLDYWCNHLAALAGLPENNSVPQFKPWVSTANISAADRIFHSPGRYVLVNDLVFANSWDDLVAGTILNPLNVDENSQTLNTYVWTGTRPDGTAILTDGGNQCDDWTDDSVRGRAHVGRTASLDGDWTLISEDPYNPSPCAGHNALYCFESP